jgi:hypothetical protein
MSLSLALVAFLVEAHDLANVDAEPLCIAGKVGDMLQSYCSKQYVEGVNNIYVSF